MGQEGSMLRLVFASCLQLIYGLRELLGAL